MFKSTILNNNFNLLRLIAAMQVLLVHSFNHFEVKSIFIEALKIVPGVPLFFFISGYLIGGTYIRNFAKGNWVFFRNRILRLYPALIICFIISLLLIYFSGYFETISVSIMDFLIWTFNQLTFFQFYNPQFMRGYGVGVLNGSLWTISVEIQFYLLTPIIYFLFRKRKLFLLLLFVVSLLVNLYFRLFLNWELMIMKLISVSFLPWVYMFLLGYFVSVNYNRVIVQLDKINIFLVLLCYVLSMFLIGSYYKNAMNSINPISVFLLAILVIKIAKRKIYLPKFIADFIDKNDLSYGIYIYHMPIINLLLFIGILSNFFNILLTILFSFVFTFFSWNFIEKKMLQKKK